MKRREFLRTLRAVPLLPGFLAAECFSESKQTAQATTLQSCRLRASQYFDLNDVRLCELDSVAFVYGGPYDTRFDSVQIGVVRFVPDFGWQIQWKGGMVPLGDRDYVKSVKLFMPIDRAVRKAEVATGVYSL